MKKICERCIKEIKEKEDYFEVVTHIDGKIIQKKYIHKKCQDSIEEQNKKTLQMFENIGNLSSGLLNSLGIKQNKVVEIV